MKDISIFVGIGLVVLVAWFSLSEQETVGGVKLANPDIEGDDSVGLVFTDAKGAQKMLSQFTLEDVPCDPTATSSDCTMTLVMYEGKPVRVYAVLPLSITKEFSEAVGSFPFAGQLHYKDIGEAEIDTRLIKLMEENGNKNFNVIYEKQPTTP